MNRSLTLVFILGLVPFFSGQTAPLKDLPFLQDLSLKFQNATNLAGASLKRLEVDRNGVAYVLSDRGVARTFEQTLALDRSFRPLAGLKARDIALGRGELYYLFDDRWLSNGESGRPLGHLPEKGQWDLLAVGDDGTVLLAAENRLVTMQQDQATVHAYSGKPLRVLARGREFFILSSGAIHRLAGTNLVKFHEGKELTALAVRGGELLIGTRGGYFGLHLEDGSRATPLQAKLPVADITALAVTRGGLWVGTSRGVFFQRDQNYRTGSEPLLPESPTGFRYYASKRWLNDDAVVDLKLDSEGQLLVLTKTGLNKIELRPMTLAEKAEWFDRKMRLRHVRFGLAGERRLPVPGDLAGSEIIDTDNDGGWSSYYLASQAFRFAATGSETARTNAWEVFAALERLQTLPQQNGFFARTIERAGFKFSDRDRWRDLPGGDWEWKGHTSSDEFTSHTFAHAIMWELLAKSVVERARLATNYTAIIDHIIRNNWYLVDVDGKPTLWGRWHPDYVNRYPHSIVDRRLNSAEIIAGLQLAYRMTSRSIYREKALELFNRHGYLTNLLSSMRLVAPTKGFMHEGNDMGDEWNHSDDELAFVNYWVLYRFAFTPELKLKYARAIKDHWEFERPERFPVWNFIFAACGGEKETDSDGAVWTLRGMPLDTITWRMVNSHRGDITKLPANFFGRQSSELLPPGERQVTRLNTHPFTLDGGDGGSIELPGDEYLFGYWLGRYLGLIAAPARN